MAADQVTTPPPSTPAGPRRQPVVLDDDGCLTTNHACVDCGYNLRGLTPAGQCPECGAAVERSLHDDALAYVALSWLRTVHRGILALLLGVLLLLTYVGARVFLQAVYANRPYIEYLRWKPVIEPILPYVLGITLAAGLLGALLITRQEPQRRQRSEGLSSRVLARWPAILSVAGIVGAAYILSTRSIGPGADRDLMFVFFVVTLSVAALWRAARYLVYLLGRTTYEKPGRSARAVVDAALVSLIATIPVWLLITLVGIFGPGAPLPHVLEGVARLSAMIGAFFLFAAFCGSIALLWQVRGVFARLIRQAGTAGPADPDHEPV